MTTVTVSPKFQIVIPKEVREAMGLRPGTKMQVLRHGGGIELVPIEPIENLRGFLKGMSSDVPRDEEDRV